MHKEIRINGERLINRLMEMAQIGATPKGGVCRVALTDEDKAGRDLLIKWCQGAGCTVTVDKIGNIFARRSGSKEGLEPVLAGSHLDSQPTGGKFDGVYGVLAGLEVIETLNNEGITTKHPLEVVSWTNEEGARFAPGLTGSGVFAGVFDLEYGLTRADKDGRTLCEELQRIGYAGEAPVGGRSFKAAFEAHIEQGPILEVEGKTIGIVRGVQGLRWYDLIFEGQEAHAGTTPMGSRRDPVAGAIRVLQRIYEENAKLTPHGRATFGEITAEPGSRNTVPGRLTVSLDFRHPDAGVLDVMDEKIKLIVENECRSFDLNGRVDEIWHMPPVSFAPECVAAVKSAAEALGLASKEMISGAGHDALFLAQIMPTGMIFVPCENGLSHNELENSKPEDLIAGANVLLKVILDFAIPQNLTSG
jgi:N-carbamoyl-L-amino-acid hydrolase